MKESSVYNMESTFKVYRSARFDQELSKHDLRFQQRVEKIEEELANSPYSGKPLHAKWFREKRFENFRIYYLVYEEVKSVFMVAISGKKNQQKVINTINLLLDFFKSELENLLKNND